jgi:radical SAM superfamily enzyme YgiQ (UPF0313 family)
MTERKVYLLVFQTRFFPYEDIGVSYIAAYLREKNCDVILKLARDDNDIDYQSIVEYNPALIGLPIYYYIKDEVCRFSEKIKQLLPNTNICVGSMYATIFYEIILNYFPDIDFAVIGEGEITTKELVDAITDNEDYNNIKGLAFRKGKEIITTGKRPLVDLDLLPAPSRDFISQVKGIRFPYIFTQRSCASNCAFCSIKNYWGDVRVNSIEKFKEEVKEIHSLGYKYFQFLDPSIDSKGPERLYEIAHALKELDLGMLYLTQLRSASHKFLDKELIALLKESGLLIVAVGIESFNQKDLTLYGKYSNVKDNINAIKLLKDNNIATTYSWMLWNPYSRLEDIDVSIRYLEEFKLTHIIEAFISRYIPFKGTTLFEKLEKDNLVKKVTNDDYLPVYDQVYKEEKTKRLFNYVDNQLVPYFGLENIVFFSSKVFKMLFADFRMNFDKEANHSAFEIMENYEQNINNELSSLGSKNVKWFRQLIDDMQNDVSLNNLDNNVKSVLSREELLSYINKTNKLIRLFIYHIGKKDKKYSIWSSQAMGMYYDYMDW